MAWWKQRENLREIASWGHTLLEMNPQSRLFSIGQSPAWILKAAEIEAAATNNHVTIGYIPFSGRFTSPVSFQPDRCYKRTGECLEPGESMPPSRQALLAYRKYLEDWSLSPAAIVQNFKNHQLTTTVIDMMETGTGMASFISLLIDWGHEERRGNDLERALKGYVLMQPPRTTVQSIRLDGDNYSISCQTFRPSNGKLAHDLYNATPDTRLVPNFYWNDWETLPALFQSRAHAKTVEEISANLKKSVHASIGRRRIASVWTNLRSTVTHRKKRKAHSRPLVLQSLNNSVRLES